MINVVLVEDDEVFRIGLKVGLQQAAGIHLLSVAENGKKAVELVTAQPPDMVLMDLGLPVLNGVEATSLIKQQHPEVKVLALTSHTEPKLIDCILQAGVDGFCVKGISTDRLIHIIEAVHAGHFWIDAFITDHVKHRLATTAVDNGPEATRTAIKSLTVLTEREQDVLWLIAQGKKNLEIADSLCISPGTVRVHVHSILHKLSVKDRTQAALFVTQQSWP